MLATYELSVDAAAGAGPYTINVAQPPAWSSRISVSSSATSCATLTQHSISASLTLDESSLSITGHPGNLTVVEGNLAAFSVVVTSTPAPTYQWQEFIPGDTWRDIDVAANPTGATANLTVPGVDGRHGAQYRCVVSNGVSASVTSNAATLTVNTYPSITTDPTPQTVVAGSNATFTCAASGRPDPTLQWEVDTGAGWADIPGATSTTLTLNNVAETMSGNRYQCTARNGIGLGATSSPAMLTVTAAPVAPSITTHPASVTVTVGDNHTFSVVATGTGTLTYQWQVSTDNGANWTNVGANAASYTVTNAQLVQSGNWYRCLVSNGVLPNATSSVAILTVNAAPAAPTITQNPTNQTVVAGGTATFSCLASGNPTPSYQWYVSTDNGTTWNLVAAGPNVVGESTNQLTLNSVAQTADGYRYRCGADNGVNPPMASNAAILTVTPAPVAPMITTDPANQTVMAGNNATFTVTATGSPTPGYQWQVSTNGGGTWSIIVGATAASYTVTNAQLAQNGNQYRCIASNGTLPNATSAAATLTVNAAPAITLQPQNRLNATAGQNVTFTVTATGNPAPDYQWEVSTDGGTTWANVAGATSATLTLNNVVQADSGNQYRCVVSNVYGSVNTFAASLVVGVTPLASTASIPVLSPAGLVLLALALGGLAFRQRRRRS
ncbi:MAG: immunoglobulin domain-containing protein [Proteobacteria bacterium]|nr:immunoglobulin domain-containing protein [Pseudomonadota bacterium]